MSISELSNQSGIPKTTLNGWKIRAMKKMTNNRNVNFNKKTMSSSDKFHIIVETHTLSGYDLAQYCRKNGLYVDEVKKWRSDLESTLVEEPSAVKEIRNWELPEMVALNPTDEIKNKCGKLPLYNLKRKCDNYLDKQRYDPIKNFI